jgi:hypothetical protein
LIFNACKSKENTVKRNFVTPKTTKNIIEEVGKNMFEFDWVSGKFSADVIAENKKTSFNTNFRIKNDSVIWFSISPALGIEVARVLITQDTVKFVNRLNNTYFVLCIQSQVIIIRLIMPNVDDLQCFHLNVSPCSLPGFLFLLNNTGLHIIQYAVGGQVLNCPNFCFLKSS